MQKGKAPLRPSETAIAIQAQIEGFEIPELMLRDELITLGVPCLVANELVNGLGVYFKVTNRQDQYIADMVAKGHKEKTVRDFIHYLGRITEQVLKEDFPELTYINVPSAENLHKVIDLVAAGMSWNTACDKVIEGA